MPRTAYRTDDFGPRLKTLRAERGWSQRELAEKIDGTVRQINHYETSKQYPPAPVILAMADAFGITMDAMMGRVEIRRVKPASPDPSWGIVAKSRSVLSVQGFATEADRSIAALCEDRPTEGSPVMAVRYGFAADSP